MCIMTGEIEIAVSFLTEIKGHCMSKLLLRCNVNSIFKKLGTILTIVVELIRSTYCHAKGVV